MECLWYRKYLANDTVKLLALRKGWLTLEFLHLVFSFCIYAISLSEIFSLYGLQMLSYRSMLSFPLQSTNKHNTIKRGYAEAAAISNFSHM